MNKDYNDYLTDILNEISIGGEEVDENDIGDDDTPAASPSSGEPDTDDTPDVDDDGPDDAPPPDDDTGDDISGDDGPDDAPPSDDSDDSGYDDMDDDGPDDAPPPDDDIGDDMDDDDGPDDAPSDAPSDSPDDDGDMDDSSDDTSGDDSEDSGDEESEESGEEGDDDSLNNIKKIEEELFSNLTPEQIAIKNTELKNQFIEIYATIGSTLVRINDISKSDDNIEILKFITDKLLELRDMVDFNITKAYATRSYIENNIIYQQCIATLNAIGDIIANIPSVNDNESEEETEEKEKGIPVEDSENDTETQILDISDSSMSDYQEESTMYNTLF